MEVLVVVAITGIVLALATVNFFPGDEQVARRESGMVALALERSRDTAWFGGRPTAITFEAGRLRSWKLAGEAWRADPPGDHALDDSVRVVGLYVDGEALQPGARLVFLPDGLGIAFRVALEVRGMPVAIEGDAAGSVKLAGP